ncbi:MAG: hypothetical protein SWX82_03500 [Cyanobacteriota bacterium]|nr:hypothetical protein [Cyanobacteriota bacterium]
MKNWQKKLIEEGRRKKEEGGRKKEEGRRKKEGRKSARYHIIIRICAQKFFSRGRRQETPSLETGEIGMSEEVEFNN